MQLNKIVSVNRSFQRAMRLDSDYSADSGKSVESYIPQGTSVNVLRTMAEQIKTTNQHAFTWTGPYGSGKSSLALMLCSLVGGGEARKVALKRLNLSKKKKDDIVSCFGSGEAWSVYAITGRQARLIDDLAKALRTKATEKNVVAAFKKKAEKENGLLLIIDELGKYLEADCATENAYLLQELAEVANRSKRNVLFIGILHQAVDVYASSLPQQVRDEWDKVRGRFSDIALLGNSEEVLELLGKAIVLEKDVTDEKHEVFSKAVTKEYAKRRQLKEGSHLEDLLQHTWPINPVLSMLLGPISRRKFSQNERSIYSFLNSREPFGFQEFLETHKEGDLYSLADYWDYVRANYETSILSTSEGHRWMAAVDAVERTERNGKDEHVRLMKTLALIDLFRAGSGIEASLNILSVATGATKKKTEDLLKDLLDWKVAIARHHIGAYAVFEGSDFNLDRALSEAIAKQNGIDASLVGRLLDLSPIIARDAYRRFGTMRWFKRVVLPREHLRSWNQEKREDDGTTGAFVLVIPEEGKEQSPEKLLNTFSSEIQESANENFLTVIGVPQEWTLLRSMLLELQGLYQVAKAPELEGDETGRKEVATRTTHVRDLVIDKLMQAFNHATWKFREKEPRKIDGQNGLSAIANSVVDEVFVDTLKICNELINRDFLSSNIGSARKSLMKSMLEKETEAKLGYEKFPPEYALYLTMLRDLHKEEKGKWHFALPEVKSGFWHATLEFLKEQKNTTLDSLYKFWRKAPLGLRYGPMPILALAFCLANRANVAVYQNTAFIPEITSETIDEWLVDPKAIAIRVVAGKGHLGFLKGFSKVLERYSGETCEAIPLEEARALVKLFLSSPKWSQHSTSFSAKTVALKQTVLKASDPIKLLYDDIPAIFETDDEEKLVELLDESIGEYQTAMPMVIEKTSKLLINALKADVTHLEDLKKRATSIRGLSGKMILEAFISRLEKFENSKADIEGLIGLAAAKPSFQWTDNDISVAHTKLAELAYDFRKIEATAALRDRPIQRRVFSVVFGGKEKDVQETFDISEAEMQSAKELSKNIEKLLKGSSSEIALAALAEAAVKMAAKKE